jgi:hypothetical protein
MKYLHYHRVIGDFIQEIETDIPQYRMSFIFDIFNKSSQELLSLVINQTLTSSRHIEWFKIPIKPKQENIMVNKFVKLAGLLFIDLLSLFAVD